MASRRHRVLNRGIGYIGRDFDRLALYRLRRIERPADAASGRASSNSAAGQSYVVFRFAHHELLKPISEVPVGTS